MLEKTGRTVDYCREDNSLVILDQTLLPNTVRELHLKNADEIVEAIKSLRLRGAPCIGVSAAIALSVLANDSKQTEPEAFKREFLKNCEIITSARPTAVNLFWAAEEMKKAFDSCFEKGVDAVKAELAKRAEEILEDDIARCRSIGRHGAELLKGKHSFLTHCNAGRHACVKYGTALAPVYFLKEQGEEVRVYADETRPLLQGARLTAYELTEAGIDTTVICDNMASYVMKNGLVDAVITGADRIAANGDAANKIGTSSLAVLAKYYKLPFYICAPFSTVDFNCESGESIKIEMRDEAEISEKWYSQRMTPKNVKCLNPAFDVTDASLITAFITERGVFAPSELKNEE